MRPWYRDGKQEATLMAIEEWRAIEWGDGVYVGTYEVGDLGNVRSVDRVVDHPRGQRKLRGRMMKLRLSRDKNGYLQVDLRVARERRTVKVHILVATAFCPNPHNYPWVNHEDCIKTNNAASNLKWNTREQDTAHAVSHGRQLAMHNPNCARKLTKKKVAKIRQLCTTTNMLQREVAAQFGVTPSMVSFIMTGKLWQTVPGIPTLE